MSSKLLGYESEIKNKDILSVQINLLNKCTSRCKSCRKYKWPNIELKPKDVIKTLKVLKEEFGLKSVFFSGGEPLMYESLPEIINFCIDNEIKYSLITTLITENENILKLIAKTAHRIHASFDTVDEISYYKIRGVNKFETARKNLVFINSVRDENKIPVRISSTIGVLNKDKIIDLYNFAKKYNCLINFYLLHTWDNLKLSESDLQNFYSGLKKIAIDEKENKKIISNSRALILKEYDFIGDKINICYLPTYSMVIDANGGLYPCCRLLNENGDYNEQNKFEYGNITGKSESEIKKEIEKRTKINYPISNTLCEECGQRYDNVLVDLQNLVENKKEVLFF